MSVCNRCQRETNSRTGYTVDNQHMYVCDNCYDELERHRIDEICKTITGPDSFQGHSKSDLSECFWTHLGIYAKHPNQKSFHIVLRAYLWAVHDDKGLANSFHHAMKWIGIKWWNMPDNLPIDRSEYDD